MFLEILLILIVALIVIKPQRLPELGFFLGRCLQRFNHAYQQILEKYQNLL